MRFGIERLDHLVLTCRDLEATAAWYQRVLGMQRQTFGQNRTALTFGNQKINLHQQGNEVKPNAAAAAPGTADLCFVTSVPTDDVVAHLRTSGVAIEYGPLPQSGAVGQMTSVYCRDPDGNLIEIATYIQE
jgi:catechol 2,3-dioxygenase-like lactoylglutathione lyase family enzyme